MSQGVPVDVSIFFWAGLTCFITLIELRGGLPVALATGIHPLIAYGYCVAVNILVTPVVLIFLNTFHKLLLRCSWYKRFSDKLIERARTKVKAKVEKYGFLGLVIFVGIPLPVTGAYTGALGAWVLGMDMKKSFLAISLGVAIAGLLILGVFYSGSALLKTLFMKSS
jgi:uncharacterized membrane protein